MTVLTTPFQSTSWVSWSNVASGCGCFLVQERTVAGHAKNERVGRRLTNAEEDLKPFRIIFSTNTLDTLNSEKEREHAMATQGDAATSSTRAVVAVSSTLASILQDWSRILQAWQALDSSDCGTNGRRASQPRQLSQTQWQRVLDHMKSDASAAHAAPSSATAGVNCTAADESSAPVAASAAASAASVSAPRTAKASSSARQNGGVYYSLDDTILLRLCDLWSWRSPQLTLLAMIVLGCGGYVTGAPHPWLSSWPLVLCAVGCLSLPVGFAQTHRRRIVLDSDPCGSNAASASVPAREEGEELARAIACDAARVKRLSNITARLLGQHHKKEKHRRPVTAAQLVKAPLGAVLIAVLTLQAGLVVTGVSLTPHTALHLLAAPLVVLSLAVAGAVQLVAYIAAEKKGRAAAPVARGGAATNSGKNASAHPTHASNGHVSPRRTAEVVPSAAANPKQQQQSAAVAPAAGAEPVRSSNSSAVAASIKYRLPPLNDKEATVVDQLSNYGAPFSMALLKAMREWNQENGWVTRWQRALRYEERNSKPDSIDIRLTASIPHTNVGTLQALLLDDPDFLDSKSTAKYQYTPMLSQCCVVKRLGYNMAITLERYRSPVYGVAPLELLHYTSPANLLDPAQQQALEMRRPFASAGAGDDAAAPLDENGEPRKLMAFIQCCIPCPADLHPTPPCQPPHVRGATSISFVIGMEEADGSLTLGICTCLSSRGIIPKEWFETYKLLEVRRAHKMVELLGQEGPKENQLATYVNQRDFQPYLNRQADSETESQQQQQKRRVAARRAATQSWDALVYSSGSALLTSEMELAIMSPLQRSAAASRVVSASPSGDFSSTTAPTFSAAAAQLKLPKLPERFLFEMLTLPQWTLDGEKDGITTWSCPTPLTPNKATRCAVFVPQLTVNIVESVLLMDRMAPECYPLVERRVTVTPANLPSLLMNAVSGANTNSSSGAGGTVKDASTGNGHAAPAVPLPRPDFPRDSYHGCSVLYTQYRSPLWGLAARDCVSRVSEPFHCSAYDLCKHLLTAEQLDALPEEVRSLPDTTRMLILSAEDASDALPLMKQYERSNILLGGFLCWEVTDYKATAGSGTGSGSGVVMLMAQASSAGGKLASKLAEKALFDQHHMAVKLREVMSKVAAEVERCKTAS